MAPTEAALRRRRHVQRQHSVGPDGDSDTVTDTDVDVGIDDDLPSGRRSDDGVDPMPKAERAATKGHASGENKLAKLLKRLFFGTSLLCGLIYILRLGHLTTLGVVLVLQVRAHIQRTRAAELAGKLLQESDIRTPELSLPQLLMLAIENKRGSSPATCHPNTPLFSPTCYCFRCSCSASWSMCGIGRGLCSRSRCSEPRNGAGSPPACSTRMAPASPTSAYSR